MSDYDYSNYDYSNHVENFSTFRDSVNQVPNMKNQEIGEALLAFVNPILMGASKTALSKWAAKRKNNRAYRKQQNERGEPEEEEAEDVPEAPTAEAAPFATQTIENPVFAGTEEAPVEGAWYGQPAIGEEAIPEEAIVPETQASAGGVSAPPEMPDLDAAPAAEAGEDVAAGGGEAAAAAGGEAAAAAGGEATAGEILATTGTLALDTSWMPEVSTVIAVGGLVAASAVGFMDLFKHPSEKKLPPRPPPLETLPQLGI